MRTAKIWRADGAKMSNECKEVLCPRISWIIFLRESTLPELATAGTPFSIFRFHLKLREGVGVFQHALRYRDTNRSVTTIPFGVWLFFLPDEIHQTHILSC